MSKSFSELVEQYQISFQINNDVEEGAVFLSNNSGLSQFFNANNTLDTAHDLQAALDDLSLDGHAEIGVRSYHPSDTFEIYLYPDDHIVADDVSIMIITSAQEFITISSNWYKYVYDLKHRAISVPKGQDIIRIISDDVSNAVLIYKPAAFNYASQTESSNEFYTVSNYPDHKQKELTAEMDEILNFGSSEKIFEQTALFLNNFSSGTYDVSIHTFCLNHVKIYHNRSDKHRGHHHEVAEHLSTRIRRAKGSTLLFSRCCESLDPKRIAYYTDLISSGKRPKIITYTHLLDHNHFHCAHYVIDGHHKLMAYQQLNINPVAVYISRSNLVGKFDDEIIAAASKVLGPDEFRGYFSDASSENFQAYMLPPITAVLDHFLKNEKNISINLIQMLSNAYRSEQLTNDDWAKERLKSLSQNVYKGKGLFLQYQYCDPTTGLESWKMLPFVKDADFEFWKKIYLEGEQLPTILEEELKNKTTYNYAELLHDPIIDQPPRSSGGGIRGLSIFVLVIVILRLLLLILK